MPATTIMWKTLFATAVASVLMCLPAPLKAQGAAAGDTIPDNSPIARAYGFTFGPAFMRLGVDGELSEIGYIVVRKVVPGSAAAKAGLEAGDTILTVDGRPTNQWGPAFPGRVPGRTYVLRVLRDEAEREIRYTFPGAPKT